MPISNEGATTFNRWAPTVGSTPSTDIHRTRTLTLSHFPFFNLKTLISTPTKHIHNNNLIISLSSRFLFKYFSRFLYFLHKILIFFFLITLSPSLPPSSTHEPSLIIFSSIFLFNHGFSSVQGLIYCHFISYSNHSMFLS